MITDFWQNLPRPIFVLAPMSGVTDAAFRRIWSKYGKPHVIMTEFVSCDGLCSSGRESLLHDLWYSVEERPIVAQIFSSNPDNIERAATLVAELGYDGIDINAGCPDRSVEKQGAGAALTREPALLRDIVLAARRGSGGLPISVKTRLGYDRIDFCEWIPAVLEAEPAALTVHARTRAELSRVPAHWEVMGEIADCVRRTGSKTPILGNGDVTSLAEGRELAARHDLDGIMVGRGVYGNPWFFNPQVDDASIPLREKLRVMLEHTHLYLRIFGERKSFMVMRKHYKAYATGFPGAKELRMQLLESHDVEEVEALVAAFLAQATDP